jgi:hypothetical protein
MAIGDTLVFEGIAWPAARVVNSAPMSFRTYPHDGDYRPEPRTIFTLATTGRGRRWSTTRPQGFWRDFATLEFDDAEAVTAFVRRRGDPAGLLDVGAETNTGTWSNLGAVLRTAAVAWEETDAKGLSRFATDPMWLRDANNFLRYADFPIVKDLEAVRDPAGGPGFAFRARSLGTFMAVSAASALERRVAMRRCDHCRSWFEALRRDAKFCSASCRAFQSQKKEK